MIKVSIIVPVYNVEQYLKRCLDSLVNQTLQEIEILIVNDGSTDNSQNIINEYKSHYECVKSYIKENGGLSDARNYGMSKACGEYILFVDSDDYVTLNACQELYDIASSNKLDILKFSYYDERKKKNALLDNCLTNRVYDGKEFLKKSLKIKNFLPVAWNALYRTEFLNYNNFTFKKGIYHEDELWTPLVIKSSKKVMGSCNVYYNYTYNSVSITTKKDKTQNAIDIINICKELEKEYINIDDVELRKLLFDSLVSKYLQAFVMGKMYKKHLRKYIDKSFVFGKSYTTKNKLKVILFCLNSRLYYLMNILKNNM